MLQERACLLATSLLLLLSACGNGAESEGSEPGPGGGEQLVLDFDAACDQQGVIAMGQAPFLAAQTFTARHSGRLAFLELCVTGAPAPDDPSVLVEIWPTTPAGTPIDDPAARLASQTVPVAALPPPGTSRPLFVDFQSSGLALSSGATYAVVVGRDATGDLDGLWHATTPRNPDGQAWFWDPATGWDVAFAGDHSLSMRVILAVRAPTP